VRTKVASWILVIVLVIRKWCVVGKRGKNQARNISFEPWDGLQVQHTLDYPDNSGEVGA
jgi:hypothetical protein